MFVYTLFTVSGYTAVTCLKFITSWQLWFTVIFILKSNVKSTGSDESIIIKNDIRLAVQNKEIKFVMPGHKYYLTLHINNWEDLRDWY